MNAIRNVFAALANLAASLNGLAGVLDTASDRLRQQLAAEGGAVPVLEHNGTVIDAAADNGSAATKRGRKAS